MKAKLLSSPLMMVLVLVVVLAQVRRRRVCFSVPGATMVMRSYRQAMVMRSYRQVEQGL